MPSIQPADCSSRSRVLVGSPWKYSSGRSEWNSIPTTLGPDLERVSSQPFGVWLVSGNEPRQNEFASAQFSSFSECEPNVRGTSHFCSECSAVNTLIRYANRMIEECGRASIGKFLAGTPPFDRFGQRKLAWPDGLRAGSPPSPSPRLIRPTVRLLLRSPRFPNRKRR